MFSAGDLTPEVEISQGKIGFPRKTPLKSFIWDINQWDFIWFGVFKSFFGGVWCCSWRAPGSKISLQDSKIPSPVFAICSGGIFLPSLWPGLAFERKIAFFELMGAGGERAQSKRGGEKGREIREEIGEEMREEIGEEIGEESEFFLGISA